MIDTPTVAVRNGANVTLQGLTITGASGSAAADGVHCLAPDGALLGKILTPERVANLTFGGPKKNRLFLAATTSVYAIYTDVTGAQVP